MIVIADVVDWAAILEVIWVSLLAGIGVTMVYAVAIVGLTRAADLSRHGRVPEAVLLGALGAVALVVVVASVVFGIVAMTSK